MKIITNQKNIRRSVSTAALLIALVALSLSGCKKAAPPAAPPPVVEVMTMTATNASASVEFIGQLDSPQNVEVRARVEAFVDKMLFMEGTEVKERSPLFKLDDKPYQERLAAANGMLAEAKAALGEGDDALDSRSKALQLLVQLGASNAFEHIDGTLLRERSVLDAKLLCGLDVRSRGEPSVERRLFGNAVHHAADCDFRCHHWRDASFCARGR